MRKGSPDALQTAILPQSLAIEPHFVRKGCARTLCKSQVYRSFWRSNLISCERVAPGRFANRNFTAVFDDRTSFRAKGLRPDALQIAILPQFLTIEPHFVRKGCARTLCKSQFYRSFWRSNLISCERVAPGRFANRNFTAVFGDRTSFRAKGLRLDALQIAILPQFWRSNLISCERVAPGRFANRKFTAVFGDRTSFRAKGLRFVPSRWHCPAPSREK